MVRPKELMEYILQSSDAVILGNHWIPLDLYYSCVGSIVDPASIDCKSSYGFLKSEYLKVYAPSEDHESPPKQGVNSQVFLSHSAMRKSKMQIVAPLVSQRQLKLKGIGAEVLIYELEGPIPNLDSHKASFFDNICIEDAVLDESIEKSRLWRFLFDLIELVYLYKRGRVDLSIKRLVEDKKERSVKNPKWYYEEALKMFKLQKERFSGGEVDLGELRAIYNKCIIALDLLNGNYLDDANWIDELVQIFIETNFVRYLNGNAESFKDMFLSSLTGLLNNYNRCNTDTISAICLIMKYNEYPDDELKDTARFYLKTKGGMLFKWRIPLALYIEATSGDTSNLEATVKSIYNENTVSLDDVRQAKTLVKLHNGIHLSLFIDEFEKKDRNNI